MNLAAHVASVGSGAGQAPVPHLTAEQVQAQATGQGQGLGLGQGAAGAPNCREGGMWDATTRAGVELRNLR